MAIRGIVMGKFAFDTPYTDYIPMEVPENESDLFNYARSLGYEGHLLWDAKWDHMVLRYGNCLGKATIIHNVEGLNQPVGPHCNHKEEIKDNDARLSKTIETLEKEVRQICEKNNKIFLWIHLPHVLMGRGGTVLQPAVDLLENAKDFPKSGPILIITDGWIESDLVVRHEHAFLIPEGQRLPFRPKGKVFYFR